ncbi:MAG: CRISPR-associated endonuclease Cas2 [Planctomycetes bacterium]|nr:CRISPR-associated endonuclease Cas2 [Planctomycetota bacterium]
MSRPAQQLYLVSYDVADDRRRRLVFRALLGFGEHEQFSVFLCVLTPVGFVRLKAKLDGLVSHSEDRVLFANLGLVDGRGGSAISSIGLPPPALPSKGPAIF